MENMPFDTSGVVDTKDHLVKEIRQINSVIVEMNGNLSGIAVQLRRTEVLRDALVAGFRSMFPDEEVNGQMLMPLEIEDTGN